MASNRDGVSRGSHIVMVLPNGVRCSIIDDGYGNREAPYEVLVEDADGRGIGSFPGGDGKGIYGWLDERKLGDLLAWADHYVV